MQLPFQKGKTLFLDARKREIISNINNKLYWKEVRGSGTGHAENAF